MEIIIQNTQKAKDEGSALGLGHEGRTKDVSVWKFAYLRLAESSTLNSAVHRLEYDLDLFNIVAVDDFNMGAMENKSLNIFNSRLVLASPATATDGDFGVRFSRSSPSPGAVLRAVEGC